MENADLVWVRENAGLSQQQAAELMGVDRRTFSRWETGAVKMPTHKWSTFLVKVNTPASAIPKVKTLPAEHPLTGVVPPDWPGLSLFSDDWTEDMFRPLIAYVVKQKGPLEKDDLISESLKLATLHDAHKAIEDGIREGLYFRKGDRIGITQKGRDWARGLDLIG